MRGIKRPRIFIFPGPRHPQGDTYGSVTIRVALDAALIQHSRQTDCSHPARHPDCRQFFRTDHSRQEFTA
jgi:hypothetical protein